MQQTINNLAAGSNTDLTFNYTITESDIGKTNVINTITAQSDTAYIQAASPALKIEAVRLGMNMTVTKTNNPADGTAFGKDETVNFNIVITNTSNQTLTNIAVSAVTSGASVNTATIASLGIGKNTTVTGSYKVQQSDLGKGTITVSFKAVSGTASVQQASAAFAVKAAFPSTEAEFAALTWAEIAEHAEKCTSDSTPYNAWLGFSKPYTISGVGTFNAQLVALNNATKDSGGKAGFTFLTKEIITNSAIYSSASSYISYNKLNIISYLNNTIYGNIESALKSVIKLVKISYRTTPYVNVGTIGTTSYYVWLPAMIELAGSGYDEGGMNSTIFDYFIGKTSNDRLKYLNGVVYEWWTRSSGLVTQAYTGDYKYYTIDDNPDYVQATRAMTAKYGVVPAFCI